MKHRPALLVAILIYVALDVSTPEIPGAFVFDTADAVESTQIRARAAIETAELSAPVRDRFVLARPLLEFKDRLTPAATVERGWHAVLIWRSRALLDPAPPSEDPH